MERPTLTDLSLLYRSGQQVARVTVEVSVRDLDVLLEAIDLGELEHNANVVNARRVSAELAAAEDNPPAEDNGAPTP